MAATENLFCLIFLLPLIIFTKASSVSLISIKFIKRLDQTADDSFPGSLKCEARNRREGAAADARPVLNGFLLFLYVLNQARTSGFMKTIQKIRWLLENLALVSKSKLHAPQCQIWISVCDATIHGYICFISESSMPVPPVLPCEAAAVPLWPDLDWVFVVFGETGRCRQPSCVTDLHFEAKTNRNTNYEKALWPSTRVMAIDHLPYYHIC